MLVFLLCAGFTSAWGQNDYSNDYTGNIDLSKVGGTSATISKVVINETEYDAIKAGTSSSGGSVKITIPQGTKYLHIHAAGWNGDEVTVTISGGYSGTMSLTSDSGISGNTTTYTLTGNGSSYYKVITFNSALTQDKELTFSTSGKKKRFVIWGVTSEKESGSTPSLDPSDLALTDSPVALSFDLYDNSDAQTINYTTSSTGAITVSASDYVTTSVNATNKTITVTPTAVTPSAQTITVNQAADDTYDEGFATFTVTISNNDPNRLGGANNPYTVTQALENTPASGNSEDVYVKGIVSKFQAADIMSDGANYRYYISDDGTTNNQLLVYKGKGLNNVAFSEADDLQIGDVLVVKGQLSTYSNTKEINSGNYIVSLKRKTTPTLSFGENAYSVVKNGTLNITATSNSTGAITYESSNTDVAEIDATSGVVTAKAAGTSTITATIAATDDYKSATATVELTVTAPKHKVTFYQNGTKLSEEDVSEDAAITFPEAESEINGKSFVGWIASTIEGETNDAPAFVTTATMGTAEINYYAVFANLEGESTGTYTLDYDAETQLKNATLGYGNAVNYTAADGSQWVVKAYKSSGMQINKSKNSSIKVPTCPGAITSIAITGSTEKAVGFSANDYSGSGTINYLAEGSDVTEQTLDLSEQNTTSGYIVPKSGSISITKIVVNYSSTSYSAYCTTVEAEQPVVEPGDPVEIAEGYYSIKNGNGQYVNVAGRKTVTFVDEADIATAPGTVIRVKADDNGQVQILRSQGVDIPGYAEKAMNYVPKIVKLVVDKLHAEGSGSILGEHGLDAIMAKFDESFDYHLYTEQAEGGVRIYGKTPSMQPVVDFYAENKANVDAKLPMLEDFINSAIDKVLQKTNGSGASILVDFKLHDVWQKMGGTLTEPVDDASKLAFLQQVLANKENVWKFAYQTAMIYWTNLKNHPKFIEMKGNLGEYAQYIDKIEYIRPDVKYYLVQNGGKMDVFSQDNPAIISNEAGTLWTLENRSEFKVAIPEDNLLNGKYYTTLYTDFAYTLPEGVKAYKVTGIEESGCYGYAVTEEVGSQNIAAQTPVLLMSESAETQALTLSESGTAVTDNLLVGPDYLINTYKITAAQVESLFDMAKALLGEEGYNNYVKEYEHLMLRTAGTVNNKYFFGLSKDDCKNLDENVCLLGNSEEAGIGFANDWQTMNVNQAFLVSDIYTAIRLSKVGDINRDGFITIADLTALVDIILGKIKYPDAADMYDFGAADVNCDDEVNINDVTLLVSLIMHQNLQN